MTDSTGDLRKLAIKHDTDKAAHGYCEIYETLFAYAYRHEPIRLLELGVHKGASIRLWDEYFDNPDSDIIGIDQDITKAELGDSPTGRVRLYRSDQAEIPMALRGFYDYDVIIDDASHISAKTIASFITWWPRLKSGGLYLVEDTSTSYHLDYGGAPNPGAVAAHMENSYRKTTMQWFQHLSDHVNAWAYPAKHSMGAFEVKAVSFVPDLIVVTKK